MKPRSKQFYDELGNRLIQIFKNRYPNIKIKAVGSRRTNSFKRKSDLDIRFYFEGGNPSILNLYPKLVDFLSEKLPRFKDELINYDIGTNGNVIRCRPVKGGKVDLVLVEKVDY